MLITYEKINFEKLIRLVSQNLKPVCIAANGKFFSVAFEGIFFNGVAYYFVAVVSAAAKHVPFEVY